MKTITFDMQTTIEAAKLLCVNASRMRQLILAGRIRATKHGRDWLIDSSEIERYNRTRRGQGRPCK